MGILIDNRAKVAPPIRWISRWPAVILAVNRTAKAIGWINKLIVSIIISIGIKGIGVPCGRKWARADFVLLRNPRITAPAQSGIAIPRFIDSCVVGVNVCGRRPKRLVEPIKIISEISNRVHERPFCEWIDIICLVINWMIHCWNTTSRLLKIRLECENIIVGSMIIAITMGIPINVGVEKEANKFSFILILKD